MKKQVFIIAGAIIVLLLILVWAYLLFFGTPKDAGDVFADLGMAGEEDVNYVEYIPEATTTPAVNLERPKLRQLTTKLVAGYREINLSTTTPASLYYAEMGTGHIYTIDLASGEEKRISGTTVAGTREASFSSQGNYVALASLGNSKSQFLTLGELSTSSDLLTEKLTTTVLDFAIQDTNELLYTTSVSNGLVAKAYNLKSGTEKNVFSLPFHEAVVVWGEGSDSAHLIYPKSSYALEGYLYEAKKGSLSRLPLAGFGFGAKGNQDFIIYNNLNKQSITSYIYDRATGESRPFDAPVVPEKCFVPNSGFLFICGFESVKLPYEFPDVWYRGELTFRDSILALSASEFLSEELVNTFTESGREIDIIELVLNDSLTAVYFINKNDNTLWMYEL